MNDVDEVLASLTAERYGRSIWWKAPPPRQPETASAVLWDDSEATTARRRKQLASDFARHRDQPEEDAS